MNRDTAIFVSANCDPAASRESRVERADSSATCPPLDRAPWQPSVDYRWWCHSRVSTKSRTLLQGIFGALIHVARLAET
jgi:hypothetical protein